MAADDPACVAIAALVRHGVIQGYATAPPTFGPDDDVQRAQVAAFLVRALGWQGRPTGPRSFDDFDGLVAELRDRVAHRSPTPASTRRDAPASRGATATARFGPTDPVSHAQVITLHRPRLRARPGGTPGRPAPPAPGIPAAHATDIGTYLANAGAIPDAPTTQAGWDAPASRAWVAMVLWQALQAAP